MRGVASSSIPASRCSPDFTRYLEQPDHTFTTTYLPVLFFCRSSKHHGNIVLDGETAALRRYCDEVLQSMQQKLDDLFGEMNSLHQQYVKCDSFISAEKENIELVSSNKVGHEEGAKCCVSSRAETAATPQKTKDFCRTDDVKSDVVDRSSVSLVDHEERRMSDLSDFCWSVVSSVDTHVNGDNQLTSLAAEQELYNIQKECEEKDAIIKELTAAAHTSSNADAKRIAELQDILKRKNMVISKLKKDMSSLKQMVVELTRAKRASSVNLNTVSSELPVMSNNLLYDMNSSSPSSSDSESPVTPRELLNVHLTDGTPGNCESKGSSIVSVRKTSLPVTKSSACNLRPAIPFKETCLNPKVETSSVGRQKQLVSSNGDFKKTRRQSYQDLRNKATKRWM
nr:uncharacterized protein LOC127302087 isoform X2 [Lolium perenne]XP_051188397.1 uncharacterized protein LOC127302087 isoform X3 [Lolium perenne]XP_051188398.1 uncharacterized protein LOC127302087 isoform X4 [Lolium perenne]XP_051188399.1 uncharacterized protein LOC127302087 isoform X5 [Lolium perenne]XP_051188400.1 uncharacterized protein LOC127302087 isoform X6 [Lolium perenne]XP_051188402.1 uncharacterized protein LOC127302087 isoform X7 [Lolium perenne]XP_051188403.1 uncharacterized prot